MNCLKINRTANETESEQLHALVSAHHGTVRNEHQLDTLFLVCLLEFNASTCFGRYSPIFTRLCADVIWCNCVCRMCVDYMQFAVEPQTARSQHTSYARNYTKQHLR
jgi:hypothetical protein